MRKSDWEEERDRGTKKMQEAASRRRERESEASCAEERGREVID